MRYLLLVWLMTGCVNGTPYEPCPTVIVYMTLDRNAGVLATDSIDYMPECP